MQHVRVVGMISINALFTSSSMGDAFTTAPAFSATTVAPSASPIVQHGVGGNSMCCCCSTLASFIVASCGCSCCIVVVWLCTSASAKRTKNTQRDDRSSATHTHARALSNGSMVARSVRLRPVLLLASLLKKMKNRRRKEGRSVFHMTCTTKKEVSQNAIGKHIRNGITSLRQTSSAQGVSHIAAINRKTMM